MTKPKPGKFNFVLEVSVCFMLIVAVYCGWSFWYYGDCCKGWQYINGVRLSVGSNKLDFGEIMVGESKTGFFKLHNLSSKPVVVLGAEVGCGCLTTTELPLIVQPYQRVDFALTLQPGENQIGKLGQVVLLNLNVEQPNEVAESESGCQIKTLTLTIGELGMIRKHFNGFIVAIALCLIIWSTAPLVYAGCCSQQTGNGYTQCATIQHPPTSNLDGQCDSVGRVCGTRTAWSPSLFKWFGTTTVSCSCQTHGRQTTGYTCACGS